MRLRIIPLLVILIVSGCNTSSETDSISWNAFYKTEFFREVQMQSIFPDSKTFTDCTPKRPLSEILRDYDHLSSDNEFDLAAFVESNFEVPESVLSSFQSDTSRSMRNHIISLWDELTRNPDGEKPASSLLGLPHPYVVPGGRFREVYYWDSYFTLLGLIVSGRAALAENMVNNFAYLIDTVSFIPNGNRAYYLGRSQPPFFAPMVDLIAENDRDLYLTYLPRMQREYDFWMAGADSLSPSSPAIARVVRMDDGSILNRYWDEHAEPRPESFREDVLLVRDMISSGQTASSSSEKYRHLRAGAESGWDFSSRWFADGKTLQTIHTTDIIPVDLNSLMYFMEMKLAQGYDWAGNQQKARDYLNRAMKRKSSIQKYLWDDSSGFYIDYDFVNRRSTGVLSLASAFPLYFKIADKSQAKRVAAKLNDEFLKGGGFVTTLNETGQQWDWPNGWAPLQWITVNGLYQYNYADLGNEAAQRWLDRNREVYRATGKMMEKYNVVDTSLLAGGGEYALQDGFGWTNGVALAMLKIFDEKEMVEGMMEMEQ